MLKRFQKTLRINQTNAENRLWYHLRNRRFQGWKFRRQHALQGYIVDFVCLERKLVIELDGRQHADQELYDNRRTQVLEKDRFKVIRFWNNDVLSNLESALETVLNTPSLAALRRPLPQWGEVKNLPYAESLSIILA